jgi:hypothetical protein
MTSTENKILSKIALSLFHLRSKKEANEVKNNQFDPSKYQEVALETTSSAMRSKLRYIGGNCIFKAREKIRANLKSTLQNTGHRSQRQSLLLQNKIISKLRVTEAVLNSQTSNDNDSLTEIKFKQNKNCGLTNISDQTFTFFTNLYLATAVHLDERSFHLHASDTFSKAMQAVFSNLDIWKEWLDLCQLHYESEEEMDEEAYDIVYLALLEVADIVVIHFVKVMFAEKLKQFKSKNSHQKSQALRPSLLPERKKRRLNPK